jgi:hypothetical protein
MRDEPDSAKLDHAPATGLRAELSGRMPFADAAPLEFKGRVRQWL